MFRRTIGLIIVITFVCSLAVPVGKAQDQNLLGLPEPGNMVSLSPAYEPALIKGLTVHKDNPFLFDFIVDTGHSKLTGDALKKEGDRLIKYFFAALTIPDKDLWVNLSPYEKDRMVPQALGLTAMGRDLLAQDYLLKQLTASLIYPEKQLGRSFWDKVYAQAREQFGTTNVPVNTFNKVWIVAQKASVYEHNQTAFIVSSHLKVMLEEDYLALQKHTNNISLPLVGRAREGGIKVNTPPPILPHEGGGINSLSSQIIRAIILPAIEHEVNTGKNFATLRQIFYSQILAAWFKRNLKQALLSRVYADKSTVSGVNLSDPSVKELIYRRYLQAYKKGVFNYIKEDADRYTHEGIPRKYFSGGFAVDPAELTPATRGEAQRAATDMAQTVDITAMLNTGSHDEAMSNADIIRAAFEAELKTLIDGIHQRFLLNIQPGQDSAFRYLVRFFLEGQYIERDFKAKITEVLLAPNGEKLVKEIVNEVLEKRRNLPPFRSDTAMRSVEYTPVEFAEAFKRGVITSEDLLKVDLKPGTPIEPGLWGLSDFHAFFTPFNQRYFIGREEDRSNGKFLFVINDQKFSFSDDDIIRISINWPGFDEAIAQLSAERAEPLTFMVKPQDIHRDKILLIGQTKLPVNIIDQFRKQGFGLIFAEDLDAGKDQYRDNKEKIAFNIVTDGEVGENFYDWVLRKERGVSQSPTFIFSKHQFWSSEYKEESRKGGKRISPDRPNAYTILANDSQRMDSLIRKLNKNLGRWFVKIDFDAESIGGRHVVLVIGKKDEIIHRELKRQFKAAGFEVMEFDNLDKAIGYGQKEDNYKNIAFVFSTARAEGDRPPEQYLPMPYVMLTGQIDGGKEALKGVLAWYDLRKKSYNNLEIILGGPEKYADIILKLNEIVQRKSFRKLFDEAMPDDTAMLAQRIQTELGKLGITGEQVPAELRSMLEFMIIGPMPLSEKIAIYMGVYHNNQESLQLKIAQALIALITELNPDLKSISEPLVNHINPEDRIYLLGVTVEETLNLEEPKKRVILSNLLDDLKSAATVGGRTDPAMNGGIDLNTLNNGLSVSKDANGGVTVAVDQAMIERIRHEGIRNATPVIINMRFLPSVDQLLGL